MTDSVFNETLPQPAVEYPTTHGGHLGDKDEYGEIKKQTINSSSSVLYLLYKSDNKWYIVFLNSGNMFYTNITKSYGKSNEIEIPDLTWNPVLMYYTIKRLGKVINTQLEDLLTIGTTKIGKTHSDYTWQSSNTSSYFSGNDQTTLNLMQTLLGDSTNINQTFHPAKLEFINSENNTINQTIIYN